MRPFRTEHADSYSPFPMGIYAGMPMISPFWDLPGSRLISKMGDVEVPSRLLRAASDATGESARDAARVLIRRLHVTDACPWLDGDDALDRVLSVVDPRCRYLLARRWAARAPEDKRLALLLGPTGELNAGLEIAAKFGGPTCLSALVELMSFERVDGSPGRPRRRYGFSSAVNPPGRGMDFLADYPIGESTRFGAIRRLGVRRRFASEPGRIGTRDRAALGRDRPGRGPGDRRRGAPVPIRGCSSGPLLESYRRCPGIALQRDEASNGPWSAETSGALARNAPRGSRAVPAYLCLRSGVVRRADPSRLKRAPLDPTVRRTSSICSGKRRPSPVRDGFTVHCASLTVDVE